METDDNLRREREIKSTLEQINSFKGKPKSKWRLDVPVWQIAVEGICIFIMAFLFGNGLAVLYRSIF